MPNPKKGDPEWDEWRHCKSKCRYPEKPAGVDLRPYRCRFCGGYHLTSKWLRKFQAAANGQFGSNGEK